MMPETFSPPENSGPEPDGQLPSRQYRQDQTIDPGRFEEDADHLPAPSEMGAAAGWGTGGSQPVAESGFRFQNSLKCSERVQFCCGLWRSSCQHQQNFAGWVTPKAFSVNEYSRKAVPKVLLATSDTPT
ncbi:MAG: hypothetical protein R6U98_12200 [Pirellulaceae bacterium]